MTVSFRTTSVVAPVIAAVASGLAFPFLPNRVATHFDIDGRPDRHSSRVTAALMLPVMMAGMTAINDRFGSWPGARDREDSDSGVQARNAAIGLIQMALLPTHLAILAKGLGTPVDMSRLLRGVFGVLMIGLGNLMPKLPRNGLVGIRTPWTLADPIVWERTHRLGGYLVMAAGFVTVASLPAPERRAARLSMTSILGAIGLSAAYSFFEHTRVARLK